MRIRYEIQPIDQDFKQFKLTSIYGHKDTEQQVAAVVGGRTVTTASGGRAAGSLGRRGLGGVARVSHRVDAGRRLDAMDNEKGEASGEGGFDDDRL